MPKDHDIPIAYVREALALNHDASATTWLRRPRAHFETEHGWRITNKRLTGKPAGGIGGDGYRHVRLTFKGRLYDIKEHRLIFALVHGHWPTHHLDHENRKRIDNQPTNLRESTPSLNAQNTDLRSDNTTGVKGVSRYRYKRGDGTIKEKWQAYLDLNGRRVFHRMCDTFEEAVMLRRRAEIIHHPYRPSSES
jgi:HNH endonuclease